MEKSGIKSVDIVLPSYTKGYSDREVKSIMEAMGAAGARVWLEGQEPWQAGARAVAEEGALGEGGFVALAHGSPKDVEQGAQWVASQMAGVAKGFYAKVGFLVNGHLGVVDSGMDHSLAAEAAQGSWRGSQAKAQRDYMASPQKEIDDGKRAQRSAKAAAKESALADSLLAVAKAGGDLSANPAFYDALGDWAQSLDGAPKSCRLAEVAEVLRSAGFKPVGSSSDFERVAGSRSQGFGIVGQMLSSLDKGEAPLPVTGDFAKRCAASFHDPAVLDKLMGSRNSKGNAAVELRGKPGMQA